MFVNRYWIIFWVVTVLAGGTLHAEDELTEQERKFFETKIRPVLVKECYGCHSSKVGQVRGGLLVDTKQALHVGGDSGPAVVPGDLDESLLWSAINYEDYNMPPGRPLSDQVVEDFRQWIAMGAPDPRERVVETVDRSITEQEIKEGRKFWSFVPPVAPTLPDKVPSKDLSAIDYLLQSMRAANDVPHPESAAPESVLRRLTYDLNGLPPTPEQSKAFMKAWKKSPQNAMESLADQLLEKDAFGERWGRHWLDVARYAESSGKELNITFPHAWRYRDYVIDSFNKDKPYDRFLQEQIAGDLLPVNTDAQWAENLTGTGFLAIGPKTLTEQNGRQFTLDTVDEQIDVTTRVMLGVSVACARCHDHKFDPIPQSDYYAMAGIFQSTSTHYGTVNTLQNRRPTNLLILPHDPNQNRSRLTPAERKRIEGQLQAANQQMAEGFKQRRERRKGQNEGGSPTGSIVSLARASAKVASLEAHLNSFDDEGKPLSFVMGAQDSDRPEDAYLLVRGEFDKPADRIARGFPQVLTSKQSTIGKSNSGRLELARWIASKENPLTARVMVNRIWQHLFGNGLVRTPENFGATGLRPTHPQLLDYLAVRFMERNWSVKRVIREIVLSRAYRASSDFDRSAFKADPENKYLWRVDPKRLDAESLRDSLLAISGRLDSSRPEASVVAKTGPAIVRDGEMLTASLPGMGGEAGGTRGRRMGAMGSRRSQGTRGPSVQKLEDFRSVYLPIVRDEVPRALDVFDFAESTMVVGKRESSNTPDQGLYFLNNAFVIEQSDEFAKRLMSMASHPPTQIELAFEAAMGRGPTRTEKDASLNFLRNFFVADESYSEKRRYEKALSAFCQSLFASAEFRFLD